MSATAAPRPSCSASTESAAITALLHAWAQGDRGAFDRLTWILYEPLLHLARAYLRREGPDQALSPTELVSEAFLRLAGGAHPAYDHRAQFFAVAARHMRRILIDQSRRRAAGKRGGRDRPVAFDEELVASGRPEVLCELDEALAALAAAAPRQAHMVELHYFGGMSHQEIAAALSVHKNTVARDLRLAQEWLHRHMTEVVVRGSDTPTSRPR